MGLRYRVPLPGPFYYSGRVGPKHWLPRGSHSGPGLFYFAMKWLVIYPSVFFFGVGLVPLLAPFYGVFWLIRRQLRTEQRRVHASCFPVQRPVSGSYGFVPARQSVPVPAYVPSLGAPRG